MEFIAHIREDGKIQSVEGHLTGVQTLAEIYGEKIGIKHICGLAGMLHDIGKYTVEFKEYILEAIKNPENPPKRGSVDHSTAGGKLLFKLLHGKTASDPYKMLLAEIVGNAIIAHHSYLKDFLSPNLSSPYLERVEGTVLKEFNLSEESFFDKVMTCSQFDHYIGEAAEELKLFHEREPGEKTLMFLTKFVFSTLIDADRTDTRKFAENDQSSNESASLMSLYYERLMSKISSFKDGTDADHPINRLRSEMSDQCEAFAEKPSGIYTLSIPTGGGKTLASLRYALKHALTYQKKRIFYILPFTTIIEQNAEEVRKILNDREHILEHHSNVIEEQENEEDEKADGTISAREKLKLAKDNWETPIVFTTMVQFLNAFYAKGTRNIRRLHNLSDSVIIFDEVQKVPVRCVSLFNHAINFLKTHCHASIVLCTATQPALDYVEHRLELDTDGEMVRNLDDVVDDFKRVDIIDRATDETFGTEKLAQFVLSKAEEIDSVLVILNTKKVVKDLYEQIKGLVDIPIFHLSTSMCAAHRKEILENVRELLRDERPVICLSTQLIEAGVDVSFKCAVRSIAGLDSTAQAAGRCNRHGKDKLQYVYVIDHVEEELSRLKEIQTGKRISKKMFIDLKLNPEAYNGSILSTAAMSNYFREFYSELAGDLNYFISTCRKDMTDLLMISRRNNEYVRDYREKTNQSLLLYLANSYGTAADHFQVIDQQTQAVLVPYRVGKRIIAEFNGNRFHIEEVSQLLKEAQQYSVNLYRYEIDRLNANGGITALFDGSVLALIEGSYSEEFGVDLENETSFGFLDY